MSSKKKYILLFILVFALLIVIAVFANKWRDNTEYNKITITGNYSISKSEILSYAKMKEDSIINTDELSFKMIQDRIAKNPEIKKVSVSKEPPDEIKIEIVEKRPIAILNINDELKLIDEELEMFQFKNYQKIYDLPVITGLSFSKEIPADSAKSIQSLKTAVFIVVEAMKNSKSLYSLLSEINVSDSSMIVVYSNNNSLRFYFPKVNIKDELSKKELHNTLIKFFAFSNQISATEKLNYVDLRFDDQIIINN